MAGAFVRSALKEAIRNIPEGTTIKKQSVIPQFIKKGQVTEEELEFSGFQLPEGQGGRVTKEELVEAEAKRKDWFETVDLKEGWQNFRNMEGGRNNPTYRERIYEFGQNDDVAGRFESGHYPEQGTGNYLAHASVFDNTIDGKDSRVLFEIQSDLHQGAIETGYSRNANPELTGQPIEVSDAQAEEWAELLEEAGETQRYPIVRQQLMEESGIMDSSYFDEIYTQGPESRFEYVRESEDARPPESPWKRNWLRKTMEQEYVKAVNDGKQQLVIPISGGLQNLQRSSGVQRWYETQVVNTAKKVAKQTGGTFELVTEGSTGPISTTEQAFVDILGPIPEEADPGMVSSMAMDVIDSHIREGETDKAIDAFLTVTERLNVTTTGWEQNSSLDLQEQVIKAEEVYNRYTLGETSLGEYHNELSGLENSVSIYADKMFWRRPKSITYAVIRPAMEETVEQTGVVDKDVLNWLPVDKQVDREGIESAVDDILRDSVFSEDYDDLIAMAKELNIYDVVSSAINKKEINRALREKLVSALDNVRQSKAISPDEVASDTARWDEANKNVVRGVEGAKEQKAALDAELREKYNLGSASALKNTPVDELLVNKPTKRPKPFSVNLYTTPTAVAFAAYNALEQGYSEDEVRTYLDEAGYDYDQMAPVLTKIQQAKAAGYNDEEIREYMEAQEPKSQMVENKPPQLVPQRELQHDLRLAQRNRLSDEDIRKKYKMSREEFLNTGENNPNVLTNDFGTGSPKDRSYNMLFDIEEIQDVKSLVAHMEVIKPTMTSTIMTDVPAMFGNEAAAQRYQAAAKQSQLAIQTLAQKKLGIQLRFDDQNGQWLAQMDDGTEAVVTPGLWESIKKSKGEFIGGTAGAIAGTIAGGKAGLAATGPFKNLLGRFAGPAAAFGGGVAGGIIGAALGTEFDYTMSAMTMHEEMNAEIMAHKALTAAELAVIGEAIGYPAAKGLGLGWKGILRVKNMLFNGNTQGAYRALKDMAFLDDSQIEEIVTGLERFAPLEGSKEQKAITAVLQTQPGMQEVVRAASGIDTQAARSVVKSTTDRASSVLEMTRTLSEPDALVSRRFITDMDNYRTDVKHNYNTVKERAVNSPNGNNFSFDFEALTIEPILERLQNNITDPTVANRFLLQANRIRTMSESRGFGDLIELRQLVNDFLYNKNIAKHKDVDMLRGLVGNIDEAIEEGAPSVVQNPKKWLSDWADARSQYSQMKGVERTALYRAMFDKKGNVKPVKPETVVKALGKYITALDGSFMDVVSQMPVKARGQYEGAVVNHLTEKFTIGVKGGMKATNFVELAKELDAIRLTTADARAAKNAILDMAEVFKNDVYLAQASGQIQSPHFQSYLTDDPAVRAKMALATGIFNYMKTWVPGQAQRSSALIKQAAKLLEKPLDVRAAKLLQEEFMDSPEILSAVRALQQASTKMAAQDESRTTPVVKIFEGGRLKGTNQVDSIPAHRIATLEQVEKIAEAEALTMESKVLDKILEQYGYKAVMQGSDRVRVLGGK